MVASSKIAMMVTCSKKEIQVTRNMVVLIAEIGHQHADSKKPAKQVE